jgi:phosphoketolase
MSELSIAVPEDLLRRMDAYWRAANYPGRYLKKQLQNKSIEHKRYICAHGRDMPEVREWHWAKP